MALTGAYLPGLAPSLLAIYPNTTYLSQHYSLIYPSTTNLEGPALARAPSLAIYPNTVPGICPQLLQKCKIEIIFTQTKIYKLNILRNTRTQVFGWFASMKAQIKFYHLFLVNVEKVFGCEE